MNQWVRGHSVVDGHCACAGNNESLVSFLAGTDVVVTSPDGTFLRQIEVKGERPHRISPCFDAPMIIVLAEKALNLIQLNGADSVLVPHGFVTNACSFDSTWVTLAQVDEQKITLHSLPSEKITSRWCGFSLRTEIGARSGDSLTDVHLSPKTAADFVAIGCGKQTWVANLKTAQCHPCKSTKELSSSNIVSVDVVRESRQALVLNEAGFLQCYSLSDGSLVKWMDCKVCPARELRVTQKHVAIVGNTCRFFSPSWEFEAKYKLQSKPPSASQSFFSGMQSTFATTCLAGSHLWVFGSDGVDANTKVQQKADKCEMVVHHRCSATGTGLVSAVDGFGCIEAETVTLFDSKGNIRTAKDLNVETMILLDNFAIAIVDEQCIAYDLDFLPLVSLRVQAPHKLGIIDGTHFYVIDGFEARGFALTSGKGNSVDVHETFSHNLSSPKSTAFHFAFANGSMIAATGSTLLNLTSGSEVECVADVVDVCGTTSHAVLLCGGSALFCDFSETSMVEQPLRGVPQRCWSSDDVVFILTQDGVEVFGDTWRAFLPRATDAVSCDGRLFATCDGVLSAQGPIEKEHLSKDRSPPSRTLNAAYAKAKVDLQNRFDELDLMVRKKAGSEAKELDVHTSGVLFVQSPERSQREKRPEPSTSSQKDEVTISGAMCELQKARDEVDLADIQLLNDGDDSTKRSTSEDDRGEKPPPSLSDSRTVQVSESVSLLRESMIAAVRESKSEMETLSIASHLSEVVRDVFSAMGSSQAVLPVESQLPLMWTELRMLREQNQRLTEQNEEIMNHLRSSAQKQ